MYLPPPFDSPPPPSHLFLVSLFQWVSTSRGSFYNYLFIVQLPTPSRDKSKLCCPLRPAFSIRGIYSYCVCVYLADTFDGRRRELILFDNPYLCKTNCHWCAKDQNSCHSSVVSCCVLLLLLLRCCCEISKSLHCSSMHLTSATSFLCPLGFCFKLFRAPDSRFHVSSRNSPESCGSHGACSNSSATRGNISSKIN